MNVSSFLSAALLAAGALLSSCEQKPATTEAAAPTKAAAPAATPAAAEAAVYECPMQCEGSRSTQPGKCPVCEMELEKKS
jgi:hypothetical protein